MLIAAGVARPGVAIGGSGDDAEPARDSLSGLPFELLLGGSGEDWL